MIQEKGLIKKWHQKDFKILGFRVINVAQAIHHQADARYEGYSMFMYVTYVSNLVSFCGHHVFAIFWFGCYII